MTTKRVINFSPGPAKLPLEVLEKAQKELVCYGNTGVSIMEMSHRSSDFMKIMKNAEDSLRTIMNVPSNYRVLFMHGGALGQFSAVPLNLSGPDQTVDYVVTGSWSAKAAKEATKYANVNLVFPKPSKFTGIPDHKTWKLTPNAAYVYYCDNETVEGVEFNYVPETNGVPLVCDMSSNILSRPVNVSKFGVILGGAQKNAGCSGVTIVIVRDDLIGKAAKTCPTILDYKQIDDNGSLVNTISTYSVYMCGLVLEWIKDNGGLEAIQQRAHEKSKLIYDVINSSNDFYHCAVENDFRSRINVCFRVGGGPQPSGDVEKLFLEEAAKRNMIQLKGHRSVGGIRASLYNALTVDEARELAKLMRDFLNSHKH